MLFYVGWLLVGVNVLCGWVVQVIQEIEMGGGENELLGIQEKNNGLPFYNNSIHMTMNQYKSFFIQ